jgi:Virulence activator alpha C-term
LTDTGRAALEAWASEPRDPFLLKLFFSLQAAPAAAIAQIEAYRESVTLVPGLGPRSFTRRLTTRPAASSRPNTW